MTVADLERLSTRLSEVQDLVRQVSAELREAGLAGLEDDPGVRDVLRRILDRPTLVALPTLLLHAHAELGAVMGSLRVSREELRTHVIERLRATHGKIAEVNTTAEGAALAILNGLDSALALLGSLEGMPEEEARAVRARLQEELSGLYGHLQFQDITSQQLQGMAANVTAVERHIGAVAQLFEGGDAPPPPPPGAEDPHAAAFNPDAHFTDMRERQRQVDEAIRASRGGA